MDINPYIDHTSLISSELFDVQTWKNANKLSLNEQNAKFMMISRRTWRNQIENKSVYFQSRPKKCFWRSNLISQRVFRLGYALLVAILLD